MDNALRELAIDTLYGRSIGPRTSCLRSNLAGIQLANSGAHALSIIEDIIRTVVHPALNERARHNTATGFLGLSDLIGAYLVIGVRSNERRVFEFLRSQSKDILLQAVGCSSTFFFKTAAGYNFGVSPNKDLLGFLSNMEKHSDMEVADLALKVREELIRGKTR